MIDLLAPGGGLERAIPYYEDRAEQRTMSAAVARALDDARPLIVEAGTGTGKTLAYLIPALQSGKRVVVSTGTRALQDQISRHDIIRRWRPTTRRRRRRGLRASPTPRHRCSLTRSRENDHEDQEEDRES